MVIKHLEIITYRLDTDCKPAAENLIQILSDFGGEREKKQQQEKA